MTAKSPQRPTRIGELNRKLNLYSYELVDDGFGNLVPTFTLAATVWGRVEPLRGVERVMAAALTTTISWHITIRNRPGMDNEWRIARGTIDSEGNPTDGATVYRIVSFTNRDERDRFMTIECETLQ